MDIQWKKVDLPDFGTPLEVPEIPVEIYENRCDKFYNKIDCNWIAVYGDREHFANLHYFTEFDPRFEEALLMLGPDNQRYLVVGNEGLMYKPVVKPNCEIVLSQTFSLLGQDRVKAPKITDVFKEIGLKRGDTVGVVGWKYLEDKEKEEFESYFVPVYLINALKSVVGDDALQDVTEELMHPTRGLRAYNEVEQLAFFEWAASRASAALTRIMKHTKPGKSELEIVSNMGYAGEPFTTHLMYASGKKQIVGLRSPSSKIVEKGDGVFSAFGYRGGLSARGVRVEKENKEFLEKWAIPYFRGIVAWYENVEIGKKGGDIYQLVTDVLKKGGLRPALNPGHLTSSDEWLHTQFRPGSEEKIFSGMAVQCDIIPAPMPDGVNINCEDTVFIADEKYQAEIKERYPEVWQRIQRRRKFMRNELGIDFSENILPLSNSPAYYTPLTLQSDYALVLN